MHLFMRRKFRLTKEFRETCRRTGNRLSLTGPAVKRNFLGIAWRRWLYALVETLDSELYLLQPFVSKDNLAMDKI